MLAAKKSKPIEKKLHPLSDAMTLAQALNLVLCGKYRRIENAFTDAEGKKYAVSIYSCKAYVRADFKPRA
jgi:hypothetical protein